MDGALKAVMDVGIEPAGDGDDYTVDGKSYDRVTHILHKVLPPYLAPWAQNVGVAGAHKVLTDNPGLSLEQTKAMVKDRGLDIDSQRDAGAARGLESHLALEAWIKQGIVPQLSDFDPEHRPYAQSLAQFLVDYEPEFEASEITIWHPELRFAGTFDAIGRTRKRPKGVRHPDITGKRIVFDLKSNKEKRVYAPQHYMQLAAYRCALDFHNVKVDGEAVIAIGPSPMPGLPYRVAVNYFPARLWPPMVAAYRALEEGTSLNPNGRKK